MQVNEEKRFDHWVPSSEWEMEMVIRTTGEAAVCDTRKRPEKAS